MNPGIWVFHWWWSEMGLVRACGGTKRGYIQKNAILKGWKQHTGEQGSAKRSRCDYDPTQPLCRPSSLVWNKDLTINRSSFGADNWEFSADSFELCVANRAKNILNRFYPIKQQNIQVKNGSPGFVYMRNQHRHTTQTYHSWSSGEGMRPAVPFLEFSSLPCHQLWSSLLIIWIMSPTLNRMPASLQGMRSSLAGSYSNCALT